MTENILSHIITNVEEKGNCDVPLDSLVPVFGCVSLAKPCIKERLLLWAVENKLMYEYREVEEKTIVSFLKSSRRSSSD